MSEEPANIDLDKPSFPAEEPPIEPPPSDRRRPVLLLAVAAVLVAGLVGSYFYLKREPPAQAPPAKPAQTSKVLPGPQAEPGENIPLPPLDETDPLVRQLVERLSSHPSVARWLTTDGLITNFVVVTDRIANGATPVSELKPVGPVPPFRTKTSRNILSLDPATYARYNRYTEAVSALDARGSARLYATLKPRIGDAYRRVAAADSPFDPVLERAMVELLRVPIVEGDVRLEPKGIVYAFADPRLEGMSAAQKQLLRMGPRNVQAVQAKLREIAGYLAIPESRLPAPSAVSR